MKSYVEQEELRPRGSVTTHFVTWRCVECGATVGLPEGMTGYRELPPHRRRSDQFFKGTEEPLRFSEACIGPAMRPYPAAATPKGEFT